MNHLLAYPIGLGKFNPLPHIVCYDDFDNGLNGWMDLRANLVEPGFNPRKSVFDKQRTGPVGLSAAAFGWAGTHGSVDGLYSLKLSTRPVADRYEAMPKPGATSTVIKRLSRHRPAGLCQYEAWFTYTIEQDRTGLGEQDIRAFYFGFDLQDEAHRYMPSIRYVNSVNGTLVKRWQYAHSVAKSDKDWTYGFENEWNVSGIDPQWWGRRWPDGRTDGFQWLPGGEQDLCYNETDDKINWMYFRLTLDLAKREYVEMECRGKVFDMRGLQPTLAKRYANVTGMLNILSGIENDTNRRSYLYLDSVCISVE
jgi:hypothetical protein